MGSQEGEGMTAEQLKDLGYNDKAVALILEIISEGRKA